MYVFMITGLSLLMFVIHYVYTTVRRVSLLRMSQEFIKTILIEHTVPIIL